MTFECYISDNDAGGYDEHESYFQRADAWAQAYCESYQGYHSQDVSDFSISFDVVACFQFLQERDLAIFQLVWQRT